MAATIDVNEIELQTEGSTVVFPLPTGASAKSLPSADHLRTLGPDRDGWLEKENTSLISRCFNRWKKRYFVLIGSFLYRYADERGSAPKGMPIPLDSVTIRKGDMERCFEVVTIRKVYILRAATDDECMEWMHACRERKAHAIAENMGHRPVSANIKDINRRASKVYDEKVSLEGKQSVVENPMLMASK